MITIPPLPPSPLPRSHRLLPTPAANEPLRHAAAELETTFLAEMLRATGLGRTPAAFGGGAGEDQFASFLVHEQARAMTAAGGIGLAARICDALRERGNG